MSTATSTTTTVSIITPLLNSTNDGSIPSPTQQPFANLLTLVQRSIVESIEEQRSELAYTRPVVIIDLIWNTVLVLVAVIVIILSSNEMPKVPLRLWLVVYGVLCVINMVCVIVEYRRRVEVRGATGSGVMSISNSNGDNNTSYARHLQSASKIFSFIWWITGFFWAFSGGQIQASDAPKLYWLTTVFLAFDVFFVVICVIGACLIGIAVCSFLPCILAVLYSLSEQRATKEDIERLTMYKFRKLGETERLSDENQESVYGIMIECGTDTPTERALSADYAMCAICQSEYDDGSEIRELPCHHHFHCNCIDQWLLLNPTCPNCKDSILTDGNQSTNGV